jgi:hypothetical protein
MDITLKYKILEKIIRSDDDAMLQEIESLLSLSESDFWGALPIEVKQGINAAKGELDRGEGIPHHQVMAEIKQRFQNR